MTKFKSALLVAIGLLLCQMPCCSSSVIRFKQKAPALT